MYVCTYMQPLLQRSRTYIVPYSYLLDLVIEVFALVDQSSKLGQGLKLCSAQFSIGHNIFEGRGEGSCHGLV